jgi:hypothetical protein
MHAQVRLDERFLDRGGCGDELYGDLKFKAAAWLADLRGAQFEHGSDFDLVDDADDAASH